MSFLAALFFGCLLAAGLAGGAAGVARCCVHDGEPLHRRVLAHVVALLAICLLAFHLLSLVRGFRLGVVAPLTIVGLWFARGEFSALRRLSADSWTRVRQARATPGGLLLILAAGVAATPLFLRFSRGLVAPPLDHDALQYHLFKAGRWIQLGGYAHLDAPGAWGYYDRFPSGASVLWAWAMLPARGDAFLALAGGALWIGLLVACYSAARSLGARALTAALAALAIATTPPIASALTSSMADTLLLLGFLAAVSFLSAWVAEPTPGRAAMLGASLAIMASAKTTGAPLAAIGFLIAFAVLMLRRLPNARILALLLAATSLIGAFDYGRTWASHGSPLWPMEVRIGGNVLLAGDEEFALVHSGRVAGEERRIPFLWGRLARHLVSGKPWPTAQHVNFGWALPIFATLGAAGWVLLLKQRRLLPVSVLLALSLAVIVGGMASESWRAQITVFLPLLGRMIVVALAAICLPAALLPARIACPGLLAAVLLNSWNVLPRGWCGADAGLLPVAVLVVLAAVIGLAAATAGERRSRCAFAMLAGAVVVATLATAWRAREGNRFAYWQAAAGDRPAYDLHPMAKAAAVQWPVWQAVDDGTPHRIATVIGWDPVGCGHHGLRYPLLGSRLQNEVISVPLTKSGEFISAREAGRLGAEADAVAWLRRLRDEDVDMVLAIWPPSLEGNLMAPQPRFFTPVEQSSDGMSILNRIDRRALESIPVR